MNSWKKFWSGVLMAIGIMLVAFATVFVILIVLGVGK